MEILSFPCFSLLVVTADGGHLGMPNCEKKIKTASNKKHSDTKLNQFQARVLRYCHFRVYAIFSNGPWRPSWIVSLHKFEIVAFRDHCDQIIPKDFHVFLRYLYLCKTKKLFKMLLICHL